MFFKSSPLKLFCTHKTRCSIVPISHIKRNFRGRKKPNKSKSNKAAVHVDGSGAAVMNTG
jgi:hypothetical protein